VRAPAPGTEEPEPDAEAATADPAG